MEGAPGTIGRQEGGRWRSALLTLARERGNPDCGARFVLVGYGNFDQLVIDLPDGHASICFELGSAPLDHVDAIRETFCRPDGLLSTLAFKGRRSRR